MQDELQEMIARGAGVSCRRRLPGGQAIPGTNPGARFRRRGR